MSRNRILALVAFTIVLGGLAFFFWLPRRVQDGMNPVRERPPYEVSEAAAALHEELLVADLHADSLLWRRELLERNRIGHVDLPRLLAGNVAIQAFTAVIKVPTGVNMEANRGDSDQLTLLAIAQLWPPPTWTGLLARALYQADKLHDLARRSDGRLVVLQDREDLREVAARRAAGDKTLGAFLGIEGGQALEGRLESVDSVFAAGYRMLGLVHFYDNALGGSAHGIDRGGLTPLGQEVVARAEELGVLIDLAHASPELIDDVLEIATRPVVVSHTGVQGTCDNRRNLADRHLRAIAANGGVVGIGFWETAVCGRSADAIARSMAHAIEIMGPEHVALGSDFDGTVEVPFDASGLARVTESLLEAGLPTPTIRGVMGENVHRLLRESLPGG